jgi:hypothetical protein
VFGGFQEAPLLQEEDKTHKDAPEQEVLAPVISGFDKVLARRVLLLHDDENELREDDAE